MNDRYEEERGLILAQLNAQKFLLEVLLANFLSTAPNDAIREDLISRLRKAIRNNAGGQISSAEQAGELLELSKQMIHAYDHLIDRAEAIRRDES